MDYTVDNEFCRRFNISEIAIKSLIKFVKLLLTEISDSDFNRFSGTLYLARNAIGLKEQYHSFVICLKCNKLYNKKEVKGNLAIMKCNHIEFLIQQLKNQEVSDVFIRKISVIK